MPSSAHCTGYGWRFTVIDRDWPGWDWTPAELQDVSAQLSELEMQKRTWALACAAVGPPDPEPEHRVPLWHWLALPAMVPYFALACLVARGVVENVDPLTFRQALSRWLGR